MNWKSILLIILVILILYIIISYFLSDKSALTTIMMNGEVMSTINSTSLQYDSTGNTSSNFTYSVWFYINDWNYKFGEKKVLFGRMTDIGTSQSNSIDGINGVDPCPLVAFDSIENNITTYITCFPPASTSSNVQEPSVVKTCNVSNIPIQKWVHLLISVYGRSLDTYLDGKLVNTCLLPGVAKINKNAPIYITPNGGFSGWTSSFRYYPNALNPQEVWNIYSKGYGSNNSFFGSIFSKYQLQLSILSNGQQTSSITI